MSASSPSYTICVNGERFQVSERRLTVRQVRALAALAPHLDLVLEGEGAVSDHLLNDDEVLDLKLKPSVFCRPVTSFGAARR